MFSGHHVHQLLLFSNEFDFFFLAYKKRNGTNGHKEKPFTNDIEVSGHPMDNIEETSIIVECKDDQSLKDSDNKSINNEPTLSSNENVLTFENKAADLDEEMLSVNNEGSTKLWKKKKQL